ncbi:hypothetical protein NMG60_11034561 [Bertholletia excelsa]
MEWAVEIDKKVQTFGTDPAQWRNRSIYKIPSLISNQNKKAYAPQMVSFGPYHHGKKRLEAMEEHKKRALLHFLKRTQKSLQSICYSLAGEAQKLKNSYKSLDESWCKDTESFLRLMVVDGCFMLEILRVTCAEKPVSDYTPDDPVFSEHEKLYVLPFILLENQLPMLILIKLLGRGSEILNKLILKFCNPDFKPETHKDPGKCLHVLDLYQKSLLRIHSGKVAQLPTHRRYFKCAPQCCCKLVSLLLCCCGIDKKTAHGVLKLPAFVVDDMTESTFLNLIAFERYHVDAGHHITSFICFMDNIVEVAQDINRLCSVGVLQNLTGSDKNAATLFNTMAKDLTIPSHGKLDGVEKKLREAKQGLRLPRPTMEAQTRRPASGRPSTITRRETREMNWVIDVEQKVNALSRDPARQRNCSIYKLPSTIAVLNKKAYVPQTVSFGPYHHWKKHLREMEEHKQRALIHFLKRAQEPLHSIFDSLVEVAQELKDSYNCLGSVWSEDTERFVKLMLVDGCFMLEILGVASELGLEYGYSDEDPVFGHHGKLNIFPLIRRDMLLMENQLPMLVLFKLLGAVDMFDSKKKKKNAQAAEDIMKYLNRLVLGFCNPEAPYILVQQPRKLGICLHVLDLHRKSLLKKTMSSDSPPLPPPPRSRKGIISRFFRRRRHGIRMSVTEMNEAGILLKQSESTFLDDVDFDFGKGVLSLPPWWSKTLPSQHS